MRAWQVDAPDAFPRLADIEAPIPAEGEVVIRVEAVGLNFADILSNQGKYQVRHRFPYVPGMEFAGTVEALGPNAGSLTLGDRVLSTCASGALAELICVDASRPRRIPKDMTFVEAAGFPIAYGTSHLGLTRVADLRAGETLFVTGAAGGVGLTAVEIGKRLGARVIASARGAKRLAVATAAGADAVIDSDDPEVKSALRAAGGVDVVFDTVGGPAFDAALRATRPGGRLLAIGFASGEVPQVATNLLLVKNLTVSGFWYGGYETFAPELVAASLNEVLHWHSRGFLRPHVSQILPFEAFPDGLTLLRDRKATGKVVIRVGQAP